MTRFTSVGTCATRSSSSSFAECFPSSFDRIPGAGDIGDATRSRRSLGQTNRRPGGLRLAVALCSSKRCSVRSPLVHHPLSADRRPRPDIRWHHTGQLEVSRQVVRVVSVCLFQCQT